MDIFRLIISILFPPIGLFINFFLGSENKLQKVATYISMILSIILVCLIIGACVIVGKNNDQENDLLKCRAPLYCDPSDTDTQTCYYCKDEKCKTKGKVTCVNDGERQFNYETVAKEEGDQEE